MSTAPSTSSASPSTAVPTTTAPSGPPPNTFVVAGDGRLVALETRTGEIVRELYSPPEGRTIVDVHVTSNDRVTYIGERTSNWDSADAKDRCRPVLYRADLDTGAVMKVADGANGVESPDGRYLAYVANGVTRGLFDKLELGSCGLFIIVVRDLGTGEERVSLFRPGDRAVVPDVGVGHLVWSPD